MNYRLSVRSVRKHVLDSTRPTDQKSTVNPLYNDTHYNSKIRYNVNSVCTKISGSCIFSLTDPCFSLGKHTF